MRLRFFPRDLLHYPESLYNELRIKLSGEKPVPLFYFSLIRNVGDLISPYIVNKLTNRPIVKSFVGVRRHLLGVGSIISEANRYSIIWGSGCMYESTTPMEKPLHIASVRGPLTRAALEHSGISTPQIYGDPALLLPFFYTPREPLERHKIGLILHYEDKKHLSCGVSYNNLKIISVGSDVETFIEQIVSCDFIFSTSLHGLIVADAYGVPSRWLEIKTDTIKDHFKFLDYFSSLNQHSSPLLIEKNNINNLPDFACRKEPNKIPTGMPEKILEAFPHKLISNI